MSQGVALQCSHAYGRTARRLDAERLGQISVTGFVTCVNSVTVSSVRML